MSDRLTKCRKIDTLLLHNNEGDKMKNPHDIELVREYSQADILGYKILISEWSDGQYTVYASRMEYGTESVIMDGETTWEVFPSEDQIEADIEDSLSEKYDQAHP